MPSIVQDRGIIDLPIAYLGMAVFSLPTAFGMLALIRVMGPGRSRIVAVLIEFQFYWAAGRSGASAHEQSLYFANLYLLLNGAALVIQLLIMPRVQRSLGITGSLMVMPAILLSGAVLISLSAGLAARGALRIAQGGLKASIHRANWEQAFIPAVPNAPRPNSSWTAWKHSSERA